MSFFSAEGGPIWIKFRRLVQNDMSTAVMWSKSKPDVEFQYGRRLGEFHGMSSQSHVSHCRVLPLGEFTVTIPGPHATLRGAVTWRNQCHDRAILQGVRIPSAILKIVFRHILFYFLFLMQFRLWRESAFVSSDRCICYKCVMHYIGTKYCSALLCWQFVVMFGIAMTDCSTVKTQPWKTFVE